MTASRDVGVTAADPASPPPAPSPGLRAAARPWPVSVAWRAASAPYTCGYVFLLLVTTIVLRHVPPATATALLTASSTDVNHLARDPVQVLVASALWLPGKSWWPYAAVFMLVLAPMERRFGASRTMPVVLSGHVLATLLTELPLAAAIALHWAGPWAAQRVDVGASYVMFAAVGASAGALPGKGRALVTAAVTAWLLGQLWLDPDMTACGHLLSLAIGASWWPLLYQGGHARTPSARVSGRRRLALAQAQRR